jgi:pyridoxamine 5'-phosphate oxidase
LERYDAAACVLATAGAAGVPTARYVLCRGFAPDGFEIYTNQRSQKARDLEGNPRAALVFGWLDDDHQVRVEGPVSVIDDERADAYWASRPRGGIGAGRGAGRPGRARTAPGRRRRSLRR